jgi:hypothetical protein
MAQLGSPGVQVNVIDESFYNPATPGTVPLVILATAQNKSNASGSGIAAGTTSDTANVLYLATSQKDLTDRFGVPSFQKDSSGNAIQGSELNEYGLFAAYSFLGASNSAYILRANVDLGAITGRASAPVGSPEGNTYWVDTARTRFGVFEWDAASQQFLNKAPLILNNANDIIPNSINAGTYIPKPSIGVIGDYAIVTYSGTETPQDRNTLWFKNSDGVWVKVGSKNATVFGANDFTAEDYVSSWPAVSSKAFTSVAVNAVTYTSVLGTTVTGTGTGARFNVTRQNGVYTVTVDSANRGSGFADDDTLTIAGTQLGGTSSANDLAITVDSVNSGTGEIISISTAGVASTVSNRGFKITIADFGTGANEFTQDVLINSGNDLSASITEIATTINALLPTSVGVRIRNSKLEFIANKDVSITLSAPTSAESVLAPSGSTPAVVLASDLGLVAGVYNATGLQFSEHTRIPFWNSADTVNGVATARPTGSVWVKTTEFNLGAKWSVKRFNSETQIFETRNSPVFSGETAALLGLDPLGGGTNIPVDALYVDAGFERDGIANFRVMYRANTGATVASVQVPSGFSVQSNETVRISESLRGSASFTTVDIPVQAGSGATTIEEFVEAIQYSALAHVTATWDANSTVRRLTLTHALGGEIHLDGAIWAALGFSSSGSDATPNVYTGPSGTTVEFRVSNWKPLSSRGYVVDVVEPTNTPADNTLWYASYQNQVDLMVHNGTTWVGYKNYFNNVNPTGPFVQATRPTKQVDDTDLVEGDIWVDTSNQDEYGRNIKRWNFRTKTWDPIDVTDHTSQFGIIFSDARWGVDGTKSTAGSIVELLTSNHLDFDAPDPTAYPRGMLLWNTRRSGFNIKQYRRNYINTSETNPRLNELMTGYYEDRWVSVSGQDLNQVAHFGRKAQRAYVVGQLKVAVNTNQRILDEDNIFFNLIACPGYPELISDMVNLNSARNGTALVVGDTPLRLESNAQALINYGTDYANTGIDGEDGLHTNSDHLAVYYPSGLTTDLSGTNVVVPASHMMLRTIATSDQRSFQWFAPAGTRRGGITNATSVGYLKDGSFVPVSINQGTRDQMAQIKINPITNIPGAGLVAFGQYTKTGVNSSLDRINVARLVSYLRRQLGIITKPFLFEPNDKQTRSEIKNVCESLMLDLVSLRGIYDFIVVCDETNNTSSVISNNQLYVDIAVEPVKAVEFIYIPLRLKNVGDIKSRQ